MKNYLQNWLPRKEKLKVNAANSGNVVYLNQLKNIDDFRSQPFQSENKQWIDELYRSSWSAAKVVDVPIDDMFIYPRKIKGLSDSDDDKILQFFKDLKINEKINRAIKSSRLYGSAFLILVTNNGSMDDPLDIEDEYFKIENILVANRFDVHQTANFKDIADMSNPNFGEPYEYTFKFKNTNPFNINHTRVIRIDNQPNVAPLSLGSNTLYNWGESVFARIHSIIEQEQKLANAVAFLAEEASVPIIKMASMDSALQNSANSQAIEDKAVEFNRLKNVFRTIYTDSSTEIERLEPSFNGFGDLFNKLHLRMAAAADIPETRFFGKSPAGLNSTGDSDAQNYALHVNANQEKILRPIYDRIDPLVFKTLGISNQVCEYEFRKLIDISDVQKAEIRRNNAQTLATLLSLGVITLEDARQDLVDRKEFDLDPNANIDDPDDVLSNK